MGFGLSYTTFALRDAKVKSTAKDQVTFSVAGENCGNRFGGAVAQLYVSWKGSAVDRPVKQLMDFGKVHLNPGAKAEVELTVLKEDLTYYDEAQKCFVEDDIDYQAYISNSSDLPTTTAIPFRFQ